jgi:hypothetical protein
VNTDASVLVDAADVEDFPFDHDDENAQVLDAIVIVRYQAPDWDRPRLAYTATTTMDTAARIGALTMVTDRVRAQANGDWSDE